MTMTPLEVIGATAHHCWGIDRANRNLEIENEMYEAEADKPRRIK